MTMLSIYAAVSCFLLQRSWGLDTSSSFPPDFKFGAASAAYQVEGGWDAGGKGENIWDRYVHEHPGEIKNNETGDVSANSYNFWREDVKAAASVKVQFYRFSISWARILPTGFTNKFNKAGAKYYSDLINALLAESIEPVITLYHWDLPVKLQDLGGWTNPLIVKWFGDYARVVYSLYSDRVRTWLTINEPNVMCDVFYNTGLHAPGIKDVDHGAFLCNRHVMLAHAQAYRIFDHEFRPRCPGRVSLANLAIWYDPVSVNDTVLAELAREHVTGRYSHPIFSRHGGWPPAIEKLMLEVSLKEGYSESRLPPFTRKEIEFIRGTADFYGMNFYTGFVIRAARPGEDPGYWFHTGWPEVNAIIEHPPNAPHGALDLLSVVPQYFRKMARWLRQQYGNIDILVTENGYSTTGYRLDDYDRIDYMKTHLEEVLLAIKVDRLNIIGYGAWSLIDNFEWLLGYAPKFGLFEVDFEHPNRTRTPRTSAYYYACVIQRRSIDVPDSCFNKTTPSTDLNDI